MESLAIARELSSRDIEASALDTLGVAYQGIDRLDEAIEAFREAAAAYTECDDHRLRADTPDHPVVGTGVGTCGVVPAGYQTSG